MAEMLIQSESLTSIADKIRVLSGTEDDLGLDDMASTLNTENTNFESNLSTQDSLISQIQNVVNELPEVSDLEPILQEKTVTPSTGSQNVVADSGYDGLSKVTVNGDANLKAENIAEGVSIFGVTGTASSGGSGGGSVETCTVNLINYARDTVDFYYTQYINGSISSSVGYVYDDDSEIKNNVLKNTYIIVLTDELIDVSGSQYVSTSISGVQHIYLLDDTVTITIG